MGICPPSGGAAPPNGPVGKFENKEKALSMEIKPVCSGIYCVCFSKDGKPFSGTPICCSGYNTWANYNGFCMAYDGTHWSSSFCGAPAEMWDAVAEEAPKGEAMERTPLNHKK